jgi:hypothetical protein
MRSRYLGLLWDIGGQEGTSHHLKIDCLHWGAILDRLSGPPPYPTHRTPTEEAIASYGGGSER